MTIDKKYIDQFINVTTKAALASSYMVGKKNKIAADKAAILSCLPTRYDDANAAFDVRTTN